MLARIQPLFHVVFFEACNVEYVEVGSSILGDGSHWLNRSVILLALCDVVPAVAFLDLGLEHLCREVAILRIEINFIRINRQHGIVVLALVVTEAIARLGATMVPLLSPAGR